jgi:hypothetical protein
MAIKPTRRDVLNTAPIDPAVAQLLNSQERRQAESHLSPGDRKKKARQLKKDAERKARKVSWDIREDIKSRIQEKAHELKTSQSQVANLYLWIGIQAMRTGKIDIMELLRTSRSPQFDSNIEVPKNDKDLF